MMSMNSSKRSFAALAVALISLLAPATVEAEAVSCNMCDSGAHMTWPNAVLTSNGTTCAQMAARMASSTGTMCEEQQYFWRTPCCGPDRPQDVQVTSTPYLVSEGTSRGQYGRCNICIGGGFPGNPSMVINMLYLNSGSCRQYYDEGLQGNIPTHLCEALQFFAQEPCGCGSGGGGNAPPGPAPSGGSSGGGQVTTRKNPESNGKENVKLSNQRGGSGGRFVGGRRRLKGTIRAKAIETVHEDPVETVHEDAVQVQ